jgi:hypothetical protein
MSALSQALEASQNKAIATLGKAYCRRDDEPDDEFFQAMLHKIGEDDDVKIGFLLAAWKILREEKAAPPAEQVQRREQTEREASPAQLARIKRDCHTAGLEEPNKALTMNQASGIIEALAAGTYDAGEWTVPF